MSEKVAKPDAHIAEIASRQHGVVSVAQLHRAGLSDDSIHRRLVAGRLHRLHRGVYAVGHASLAPQGRWLAAVLAIGGGPHDDGLVLDRWKAAVSHHSAMCLWGLLPVRSSPCDVIVHGNGGRVRRAGIRVHRSLSLRTADVTLRHGIPVTTPARTIADLRMAISMGHAGKISRRELRKAIRQANVIGLPIGDEGGDRTRSDLEQDFLRLCRRRRLPPPEVNVRIGPYLVDFLWRDRRFVVETDSYLYHRGRAAFQDDHARDLDLMRLGYEVLRLSERQLEVESERAADVLATRLERSPQR